MDEPLRHRQMKRAAKGYVQPKTTAPHLDSTLCHEVTPIQMVLRNCTRNEGRSFEFGNQVLISNHRKLLRSKVLVVRRCLKAKTMKAVKRPRLVRANEFRTKQ
jgi:hypothetical protein